MQFQPRSAKLDTCRSVGSILKPSLLADPFARNNLPPVEAWPDLQFDLPELQFPDRLNCVTRLLDEALTQVDPNKPLVMHGTRSWSYAEIAAMTNRIANVLVQDCGVESGARVLLHGHNGAELIAAWLAIAKIGAIVVTTMPMLRTRELRPIVAKAAIEYALCSHDLVHELEPLVSEGALRKLVPFGRDDTELERRMASKSPDFLAVAASQDDVCLIAFTSGTTGEPKAAMHFHRDVMAMCATFAKHVLAADSQSVFSGTPPLGFTYGLGALLVFPLYFRAAIAFPEDRTPAGLGRTIEEHKVTHLFTAPTAYKAMAGLPEKALTSLKVCVSAGEALPRKISEMWFDATGIRIIDGIGSTEMIHIFISGDQGTVRPGATGKPVPGYQACLLDENGNIVQGTGQGRLAVRGPTGCRYLADKRQTQYVINGWNITGDIYRRDADGYYWHVARADDMIVSKGYNIAGPEVEVALALHPDVDECAVVGWPDPEVGQIVKAFVVPRAGIEGTAQLAQRLQDHVKNVLAPYKYPRAIEFLTALPKTTTGKLKRFDLRGESSRKSPNFMAINGSGGTTSPAPTVTP
jgi:2-aminobenzoate-CoA ligase